MEAAETLEPAHIDANFILLHAYRTFGVIDAVLFGSLVGEDSCAAYLALVWGLRAGEHDGGVGLFPGRGAAFWGVWDDSG